MRRTFIAAGMVFLGGLCGSRSVRLALFTTPDSAEYHFRLWQAQAEQTPLELDRALTLNPRYSEAWITRGLQEEMGGNRDKAEASLLRAAEIDRLYLPSWTLANFYLRGGDLPKFWNWAKRAAAMAYDPAALFQLSWHASGDAREILDRAIPEAPAIRRAYLDFLVRSNRLDAAEPLAGEISGTASAADLDLLLRYCDALLARRQPDPALRVWNAMAARRIIPYGALYPRTGSSLTNGELSAPPLQRGFDWRATTTQGISFFLDANSREMGVSLSGKQPESANLVEQYAPVLPKMKYRFHYNYHARDLAADSGLGWSFVDARTAVEIGSGEAFTTPAGCDLLRITLRYRRPLGRARSEGSAVFSRFSLEAAELHPL